MKRQLLLLYMLNWKLPSPGAIIDLLLANPHEYREERDQI